MAFTYNLGIPPILFAIADSPNGITSGPGFGTGSGGSVPGFHANTQFNNISNGVEANNDGLVTITNNLILRGRLAVQTIFGFTMPACSDDTYTNFRLRFDTLPMLLDLSSSSYSSNNNVDQISIYRGHCIIEWDDLIRKPNVDRTPGIVKAFWRIGRKNYDGVQRLGNGSLRHSATFKSTFNVAQNIIRIKISLTNSYLKISDAYSEIEIICNSADPIRLTPPARFDLTNSILRLHSDWRWI